ncbi:MFS transporter [Rhodococcus sp. JVH1]|uniref:MFS transporter n=1 Tax=Rhodococcus sp. JVH1 TaxID=745408 RepID=UPI000271E993|nr:MFS transporter [Rhodococcus sp. JVH1]EJJ01683.1 alpha-ketoglutarate permease [Rhodococcus sp. JVH1]
MIANVARGSLGNLVEWYDWHTYAIFSIYFATVFFPKGDLTAQLLSTAAVFAVGFLMRPLGGWLLGIYADRFGRRAALSLSVILMGIGSLLIGATPSYAAIGIAAPILLIVARLLQGLSVGGEFGSSATYLSEVATPGRRGFYSSFQYVSIVLGQLIALAVLLLGQALLTEEQMYEWGWRIPFFIGAAASLVVLYLRRHMDESEQFKEEQAAERLAKEEGRVVKKGLRSLFTEYPGEFAAVFALAIGGTVAFYTFTSYSQRYMVNTAGLSKSEASLVMFGALVLLMVLQPLVGHLSDRVGRRKVMAVFAGGGVLLTVPLLTLLGQTTNIILAFLIVCVAMVFLSGYTALAAIVKAEMFPTKVRALGVGLPHALVTATFGGTAETVALALKQAGMESAYFWYVTGCIALTGIAVYFIPDTRDNSVLEPKSR